MNDKQFKINPRQIFNQMIKNIRKTDDGFFYDNENIYAHNLENYDSVQTVQDDETFDDILILLKVLKNELNNKE